MSDGVWIAWHRPRVTLDYLKDPRDGVWRELDPIAVVALEFPPEPHRTSRSR